MIVIVILCVCARARVGVSCVRLRVSARVRAGCARVRVFALARTGVCAGGAARLHLDGEVRVVLEGRDELLLAAVPRQAEGRLVVVAAAASVCVCVRARALFGEEPARSGTGGIESEVRRR